MIRRSRRCGWLVPTDPTAATPVCFACRMGIGRVRGVDWPNASCRCVWSINRFDRFDRSILRARVCGGLGVCGRKEEESLEEGAKPAFKTCSPATKTSTGFSDRCKHTHRQCQGARQGLGEAPIHQSSSESIESGRCSGQPSAKSVCQVAYPRRSIESSSGHGLAGCVPFFFFFFLLAADGCVAGLCV